MPYAMHEHRHSRKVSAAISTLLTHPSGYSPFPVSPPGSLGGPLDHSPGTQGDAVLVVHGELTALPPSTAVAASEELPTMQTPSSTPRTSSQLFLFYLMQALKIIMGLIALSVIFLGLEPSKICAMNASCGAWLQSVLGYDASFILFFIFAGLNYALLSFAFAQESLNRWYHYFHKETHRGLQILKFFLVPGFAISQAMQMYYIMLSVNSPAWAIALAFVGDIASKLFTTVHLFQVDIPYYIFKCRDFFGEQNAFTRYYEAAQEKYVTHLQNKYSALLQHAKAVISKEELADKTEKDAKIFLSEHAYLGQYLAAPFWLQILMGGAGLVLGGTLAYAMALATYYAVSENIELTILFSLASSYLFPATMMQQFLKLADGMTSLAQGQPVEWLAYRASPKKTIAFTFIFGITAALSYATINILLQSNLHQEDAKAALLPMLCLAAAIFNLFGVTKLYDMMRASMGCCAHNTTEQKLHGLGHWVAAARRETQVQFQQRVETPTRTDQAIFKQLNIHAHPPMSRAWCCFTACPSKNVAPSYAVEPAKSPRPRGLS